MADLQLNFDTSKFEAALRALPEQMSKNYVNSALQAGGDVILASMKELAPERTDEATPDGTSLPQGILREDLHTQVTVSSDGASRVKIGPTDIAGHVCRWQNNGWMLTSHGKSKAGRKQIRQVPGKHFIEAAMDEAGQAAVDALVHSLAESLSLNTDMGND
jgi:hypothetical protein